MSDFVFVNNGGGGKDFLDWLNFFIQLGMVVFTFVTAFFAGYAVINAGKIYKKQKEEDRKEYIRQMKLTTLKDFVGNRNDLTGEAFSKALNEIIIVFSDSKNILKEVDNFHSILNHKFDQQEEVANKILNSIFNEMCKNLDIDLGEHTDLAFMKVFNKKTDKLNERFKKIEKEIEEIKERMNK